MTAEPSATPQRKRGRRPEDAKVRRQRVLDAIAELERGGVEFTMADVAERAGISRATLYRDLTLRDLVGRRGEGPVHRPVDQRTYAECVRGRTKAMEERRAARKELRAAQQEILHLKDRIERLARENEARQQSRLIDAQIQGDVDRVRADAYAEGFLAGTRAASQRAGTNKAGAPAGLSVVAARLPRPAVAGARRILAKALHPDLYADNPAASMLATEILKQLNSLAGPSGS
jgi:AcrR family transcriptional regulator